jgi:osmotically-inducible protein OsmY
MKKLLPILLLTPTLLLSACLPVAFVAGASAGGAVISDRRTVDTMFQDKKITCKALIQLNSEPRLKHRSHITATTFNRVVLLVGEADTPELRNRAYELVKSVPNVRRINNEIVVCGSLDRKESSLDAWMTTKVKAAMVAEKGLHSTQIKVSTEDNVVYLMGLVTHHQAELAIEVARQVSGVKKVVTLFEYQT